MQQVPPLTLSKDLWRIAKDQIDRMKVQKPLVVQNSTQMRQKQSMDQVFKRSLSTLNSIMPTGQNTIKHTNKDVPPSVKLLDRYAQKIGFLPMGQIYQGSGNKYIGRIEDKTTSGEVYYKQFPNLGQQFIDSPDITQNLSFRANRAICKWNQFVEAQSDLCVFLKKVENAEGRKHLIFEHAKTATLGSDRLRILSSLYYLYIDDKSPNKNLLMLKRPQLLIAALKTNDSIENAYNKVLNIIESGRKDIVDFINNYHEYKINSIKGTIKSEQFQQMKTQFESGLAYVPDEMIASPMKRQSNWVNIFNNQSNAWSSKIITQKWEPSADWFKPVNYIKF